MTIPTGVESWCSPNPKRFQLRKPARIPIPDLVATVKAEEKENARKILAEARTATAAKAEREKRQEMEIDSIVRATGLEHSTKLEGIAAMVSAGCDLLLEYRKSPEFEEESAWTAIRGIEKTLNHDYTFRVFVDGGKSGTPKVIGRPLISSRNE